MRTNQGRRLFTDEQEEAALQQHEKGVSIQAIAKSYGVQWGTMRCLLVRARVRRDISRTNHQEYGK